MLKVTLHDLREAKDRGPYDRDTLFQNQVPVIAKREEREIYFSPPVEGVMMELVNFLGTGELGSGGKAPTLRPSGIDKSSDVLITLIVQDVRETLRGVTP